MPSPTDGPQNSLLWLGEICSFYLYILHSTNPTVKDLCAFSSNVAILSRPDRPLLPRLSSFLKALRCWVIMMATAGPPSGFCFLPLLESLEDGAAGQSEQTDAYLTIAKYVSCALWTHPEDDGLCCQRWVTITWQIISCLQSAQRRGRPTIPPCSGKALLSIG